MQWAMEKQIPINTMIADPSLSHQLLNTNNPWVISSLQSKTRSFQEPNDKFSLQNQVKLEIVVKLYDSRDMRANLKTILETSPIM